MCYYTEETLPYITPDGYNASLGQNSVEFTCFVPSETFTVAWIINGESQTVIGEEILRGRGITARNTLVTDGNKTYVLMTVEARAENDNITLRCLVVIIGIAPVYSEEILLDIQGDHSIQVVVDVATCMICPKLHPMYTLCTRSPRCTYWTTHYTPHLHS